MLQEVYGVPADGVCEESKVVSALQIDYFFESESSINLIEDR